MISIELDQHLHDQAVELFGNLKNAEFLLGDSAEVLPKVLEDLHEPALFWLDGHFSGGITARDPSVTPILLELEHILKHPTKGHVILIDDARLFGSDGYPKIEEVEEIVHAQGPRTIEVKYDIIRISPVPTDGNPEAKLLSENGY